MSGIIAKFALKGVEDLVKTGLGGIGKKEGEKSFASAAEGLMKKGPPAGLKKMGNMAAELKGKATEFMGSEKGQSMKAGLSTLGNVANTGMMLDMGYQMIKPLISGSSDSAAAAPLASEASATSASPLAAQMSMPNFSSLSSDID